MTSETNRNELREKHELVGPKTKVTLTQLKTGVKYRFVVRAYRADAKMHGSPLVYTDFSKVVVSKPIKFASSTHSELSELASWRARKARWMGGFLQAHGQVHVFTGNP